MCRQPRASRGTALVVMACCRGSRMVATVGGDTGVRSPAHKREICDISIALLLCVVKCRRRVIIGVEEVVDVVFRLKEKWAGKAGSIHS